ncbi:MAG TPA: hypothetical protein VLH60_04990, partial [Sedimentisphaerales bacterium]|nr:hypothetical protein [Sedimentisphaerales bacterium]
SRLVADIIRNLSASPVVEGEKIKLTGLSVPYSDTVEILQLACRKQYIRAEFVVGEPATMGIGR